MHTLPEKRAAVKRKAAPESGAHFSGHRLRPAGMRRSINTQPVLELLQQPATRRNLRL